MRKRLSGSLSAKLLAGQLLVVLTGALTLLLVALLVGPAIFRMHVRDALGYVPPDVGRHLDMAFHVATLISLGVAVGASVAVALALSSIVSTRIVRPVRELAGAAQRIAHGSRDARVPARGTDELAELAGAFNEMAASLQHAEQIRSQLLADVAHELRTPLATVESYVEALADGVLAADDENWGVIRSETSRLNRLVDDLQKVSRAQAHQLDLDLAPVAVAALISDAVKAAEPSFTSKGVALEADIEPPVPPIEADTERIAEVLANLLTNALRHTSPGGIVRVSARQRAESARDRCRRQWRGDRARAPRPCLRALLPDRPSTLPGQRRDRHRPRDRPGHRRSPRRHRDRHQPRHRIRDNRHPATPDSSAACRPVALGLGLHVTSVAGSRMPCSSSTSRPFWGVFDQLRRGERPEGLVIDLSVIAWSSAAVPLVSMR